MKDDTKLTPDEEFAVRCMIRRLYNSGFGAGAAGQLTYAVFCCVPDYKGGYARDYSRFATMPREMPKASKPSRDKED